MVFESQSWIVLQFEYLLLFFIGEIHIKNVLAAVPDSEQQENHKASFVQL
jgi:hypothetical protein